MTLSRRGALACLACLPAAAARGAGDRLTIILDWLLDTNHAALFAAQSTGAFARQGLGVDLIAPSDPDSPCRLVAAGQADLAVSYGTQINMLVAAGLPVVRVATLVDAPLNTIAALGGGSIHALGDLRGKSVGVSVGGVEEAVLDTMIRTASLGPADVRVVKVNYDMVSALLAGRLDAAIGAYRNAEVLQLRMLGRDPVVFLPEEHGVPPYDELILVARRDRLGDPRVARAIVALREGTDALLAAPDATWTAFARAHPELDTPLNRECWTATMPVIARDPNRLDRDRYLAFQSFAVASGIIKEALPIGQFAVQLL